MEKFKHFSAPEESTPKDSTQVDPETIVDIVETTTTYNSEGKEINKQTNSHLAGRLCDFIAPEDILINNGDNTTSIVTTKLRLFKLKNSNKK